jgi:hypothetical protein
VSLCGKVISYVIDTEASRSEWSPVCFVVSMVLFIYLLFVVFELRRLQGLNEAEDFFSGKIKSIMTIDNVPASFKDHLSYLSTNRSCSHLQALCRKIIQNSLIRLQNI